RPEVRATVEDGDAADGEHRDERERSEELGCHVEPASGHHALDRKLTEACVRVREALSLVLLAPEGLHEHRARDGKRLLQVRGHRGRLLLPLAAEATLVGAYLLRRQDPEW